MNYEARYTNIYQPINSSDFREEITKNRKKKIIYITIFLILLSLFVISIYDSVYWKNKCSITKSTNYIFNNFSTSYDTNRLNCYVFLYGISFYIYLLCFIIAFVTLQLYNCYFSGEENNCLRCILNAISGFILFIISIIVTSFLFAFALFRNILYILIIIIYAKSINYQHYINININLAFFAFEFLLNTILVLCFVIYCCYKIK